MDYVKNLCFQKENFPEIFSGYGKVVHEPTAVQNSESNFLHEVYVCVYFDCSADMTEAYNSIFADNIDDVGADRMRIRAGFDERFIQNGGCVDISVFSPYVRDEFFWYFTVKLDKDMLKNAAVLIDAGREGMDFFKKREAEKHIDKDAIVRAENIDTLKRLLLYERPLHRIKPKKSESKTNSPSVGLDIIDFQFQMAVADAVTENREKLFSVLLEKVGNDFKEQCCRQILKPRMENGRFEDNFILTELFLMRYEEAKKAFADAVSQIEKEVKNIKKETRAEQKIAVINCKSVKRLNEIFKEQMEAML